MATKLSFEDIKSALQTALNAGRPPNGPSIWIRSIFADRVVYEDESKNPYGLWQVDYTIDDAMKVTLGTPVAVRVKKEYEVVKMAAFSLAGFATDGDGVLYQGKIFEAGSYPDKGVEFDQADLQAMADGFAPCDIDVEHVSSPLDGQLGQLQSVEARGADLFGVVKVPTWLDDIFKRTGQPVKVSVTIDKARKALAGLALVNSPRVTDAQLVAAFNESRAPAPKRRTGRPMSLKDRIQALFNQALDELPGDDPGAHGAQRPADQGGDVAQFRQENADLRARLDSMQKGRIDQSASEFARSALTGGKILPAQEAHLAVLFSSAARDDNAGRAAFSESGALNEGERVKALRTFVDSLPKLNLTQEQLKAAGAIEMAAGKPAPAGQTIDFAGIYDRVNGGKS